MSENNQKSADAQRLAFVVESGGDRLKGPLNVFGMDVWVKISSRDTNGTFAVMEDWPNPTEGPPLHLHYEEAPHGSRHTYQNVGSTPGRTVITVVPGGLDLFFEEVRSAFPPGRAPDPDKLVPIFQKHGLELLGPPMASRMLEALGEDSGRGAVK